MDPQQGPNESGGCADTGGHTGNALKNQKFRKGPEKGEEHCLTSGFPPRMICVSGLILERQGGGREKKRSCKTFEGRSASSSSFLLHHSAEGASNLDEWMDTGWETKGNKEMR